MATGATPRYRTSTSVQETSLTWTAGSPATARWRHPVEIMHRPARTSEYATTSSTHGARRPREGGSIPSLRAWIAAAAPLRMSMDSYAVVETTVIHGTMATAIETAIGI